jgi:hypothetical protein
MSPWPRIGVEPRQPHVPHEHDPKRIDGVSEPVGECLAPGLVADVSLPVHGIGGGAGHHHLDRAPVVVLGRPAGAQPDQLLVQLHADAPAHAHDHRLAVHRLEPGFEMLNDVLRDEPKSLLGADDGLELRPFALELFLARDLLAFGRLLEVRVDLRSLGLV